MPFGQPVEFPKETRECGCVVVKFTDEIESIESYCETHWTDLPEEKRAEITAARRHELRYNATTLLIRIALVGVLAFMVWTIWGALTSG
jgi:hypothetical protein